MSAFQGFMVCTKGLLKLGVLLRIVKDPSSSWQGTQSTSSGCGIPPIFCTHAMHELGNQTFEKEFEHRASCYQSSRYPVRLTQGLRVLDSSLLHLSVADNLARRGVRHPIQGGIR